MHFLFRPKPTEGEALTSYLNRIAEENIVLPHQLWRLLLPSRAHYPQASLAPSLDHYPNTLLNISELRRMLSSTTLDLEEITFIPIYNKFGVDEQKISHSKILSGVIYHYRRYCPICLSEKRVFKLIWQIKEISICPIHKILLQNRCWHCHRKIPLFPSNGINGLCPNCNSELSKALVQEDKCITQLRITEDWQYMLNSKSLGLSVLENVSNQQYMALKLLYISKRSQENITNYTTLLQAARNSKVHENYLHVNILLKILRKTQISLDDFFNLDIPEKFINIILEKKSRLDQKICCPTPWCKGRYSSGTLKRTATSLRTMKDGTKQNYYMVCSVCGIEYCLSEKILVERGYFTTLAYQKIRPRLKATSTLKQLANELHTTIDKVKRSIIFLMTNELIENDFSIISVPAKRNEKVVEAIIQEVNNKTKVKNIPKKLGLKYNEFLYYWFFPDVRVAYLLPKKNNKGLNQFSKEHEFLLQKAISFLLERGKTITIKNISTELKVCPETLRNWGLLDEIKRTKKIQQLKTKEKNRQEILKNAEEIIRIQNISGIKINCELLYSALGLNRTSTWRSDPELAKYLSNMIKNT